MPKPPRPLVAPILALALILASAPLTLVAPAPVAASIVSAYTSASREPVAPGVQLDQGRIVTTAGSQAVNIVDIDLANPAISFESSLSNGSVVGLERTSSQAQNHSFEGHRVVAAINGDTWIGFTNDMEDAPSGLHVESGELVGAGSEARPTFGVGADGRPVLGSVLVGVTLATNLGSQFVINRVNQPRGPSEVVLYTPHFGSRTSSAASGIDIVISGLALPLRTSGTWTGVVSTTRSAAGGWPIDPGTVVLTSPPTSPLVNLVSGEPVTLTTTVTAGWESIRHAVGGREWIVRDGAVNISPRPPSADVIHPRSAIGLTADGRLLLATVDGRQAGWSDGVPLPELADLMLERGAVSAINLDGGGSTTLAIRRAGTSGVVVVNRPSDGSERPVTNSILVISNAPTGPLSVLTVQPGSQSVHRNDTVDFLSSGMDWAYNPVPLAPGLVNWSVSPPIGTIDANGHFVATASGTAQVIATANGITGSAQITVLADTSTGLDFDGVNDHVTLGAATGLNSNTFTIETWFRRDGTGVVAATTSGSGGVSAAPLMAKGLSGGGTINWFMGITSDGHLAADFESASDDSNHAIIGTTTIANGTWHHAAATYDGSNFRLYLDGALAASATVAAGPGTASNHPPSLATAMTPAGVATGFFNGVLDEARVWNVARTAAEILAARDQELTSGTGLTARWGMNEGSGSAVGNSVAGGLNGIAVNGPLWVAGAPFGGPVDPPPTAPAGLTATPGNNSVALNWTANTEPDLAGYNVYRNGGPTGPTVQVAGAGDIASCSSTGDEATAALLTTISGDVLALGDTVYDSGTPAEYTNCYDPSWGAAKTRTRPVIGNHEYGTTNAAGYFGYFGAAAGPVGQGWYSYDYGTWHVIVLNSMCANVGGCGTGSPQLAWLQADLAADTAACTLALWHHPTFSSAEHGNNSETQPLYQALYDANADLILTGHDHSYERFAPQTAAGALDNLRGIRQFVVGTGGRSHYVLGTLKPNSEVRNFDTYGVIKLQLKPTSFDWAFVPEAGKTFTDSGTDECHDANGPITALSTPLNGGTLLTSPSFTDPTAVNGTSYNYAVTAVDDVDQESVASTEVSAAPVAGPARTPLSPVGISADTGEKPQSKLWFHGGAWWAVLPSTAVSPTGTWLWKLGASGTWTNSLHLSSLVDTHADATRVGDITHVLLYGASPALVSLEYVPGSGTYRLWPSRPGATSIPLPNSETATIEVDTAGRMWLASENGPNLTVRYADAPYTSFSAPVTLDANIADDDIGVVTRLGGGRIGVLWSNQNTRRFGFRVHVDGTDPSAWSADEVPASQSANDAVGAGMADDHLNVALASDGTLYAAVKTSWDTAGFARIALLIRRPSGTWDPLYPVDDTGTRPVVLLDEQDNTLRVVYTSSEGFNDIVMKTTSTAPIAFGPRDTIMSGGVNNSTKAKENWTNEGVVLASSASMAQGVRLVLHQPPANTAPVIDSVTISPTSPTTNQTLTATVTSHDAEGGTLTPSYQWTRNAIDIGGATGSTLNLATAGNGDKTDLIRVRVTVSDGSLSSTPLTSAPVTVGNTAPAATVGLSPASPGTNAIVTASATKADADSDPVGLTFVWKVNGTTVRTFSSPTALTDTLDLSIAGNGDPGQVVSVEVTPNDGTSNGSLASAAVTVASSSTTYASDTFTRTVVNNWGSAASGGAWTLSGTVADFDVSGSAGTMTLGTAGTSRTAALASVSAQDVDLSFRVATNKTPTGSNQYLYGVARRTSATNSYRLVLRIATNGQVFVGASSVLNNVETAIGSAVVVSGLSHTPGAFIRVRAQLTGTNPTTIRIRAWADGTTEPSTWPYTATNSTAALQAPGGVGLQAYLSSATTNAPVLATFDDFLATSIP